MLNSSDSSEINKIGELDDHDFMYNLGSQGNHLNTGDNRRGTQMDKVSNLDSTIIN